MGDQSEHAKQPAQAAEQSTAEQQAKQAGAEQAAMKPDPNREPVAGDFATDGAGVVERCTP